MPSRVILLAALVSALLVESLEAQRSPRSSVIGTDIFWLHNREQNEQLSPLRYAGAGSGFAVAYRTETDDWRAGLSVTYASTQLRSGISRNQEHTGAARRLLLSLPYERRVSGRAARVSGITLGAQLAGDLLYRDHNYSSILPTEQFIDAFVWLAVSADWQGQLVAGWRLHYHAALPLLGVAWRTPYTGAKYMPHAQLTLPNNLLALENRISLSRQMSRALDFRASYELQLLRHEATWDLATASNRIGIGLDWHVRRPATLPGNKATGGAQ